jgi:hypothetical protein
MSTVDRGIARRFAAGEFPEDGYEKILAYGNNWGGVSYKLLQPGQVVQASAFVKRPRQVWSLGQSVEDFDRAAAEYEEFQL